MMPDCVAYMDFLRREREAERWLSRRPKCCECGEHIQEDKCYQIADGKIICPTCLDLLYKKDTEDFMN